MGMTLFHPSPCPATPGRWTGSFGTLKPWSPLPQSQGYCIGSRGWSPNVYDLYQLICMYNILATKYIYDTPSGHFCVTSVSLSPLWTGARSSARWGRFPLKHRSLGREVLLPFCFSSKRPSHFLVMWILTWGNIIPPCWHHWEAFFFDTFLLLGFLRLVH